PDGNIEIVNNLKTLPGASVVAPIHHFQMRLSEARFEVSHDGGELGGLLDNLDIIDCPGADPQESADGDPWAAFKRHKNNRVFDRNISNIDLLLVVAKCDGQGMRPGEQFQKAVWDPWVKRCQKEANDDPDMRGRFAVVITHAGSLFNEARISQPVGEWIMNDVEGIGCMIETCFLPPLRGINRERPGAWPPFILVENMDFPRKFDIPAEAAGTARDRLIDCFKNHNNAPVSAPADWDEPTRACHNIAQHLWACKAFKTQTEERSRAYRRMIDSLLALVDPQDRGHRHLTRTLERWVTSGPLRAQYLDEVAHTLRQSLRKLEHVSDDLTHRTGQEWNEKNIRQARQILLQSGRWTGDGLAWRFTLGQRSKEVREKVSGNKPVTLETDIIPAVIEDCIRNLEGIESHEAKTLIEAATSLLRMDAPWARLVVNRGRAFENQMEVLIQMTHFLQQRLVAIFDWLAEFGALESEDVTTILEGGESLPSRIERTMTQVGFQMLPSLGFDEAERQVTSFSHRAYQQASNF
ncbi:MAG: hypothetical protein WCK17_06000, partial [Verrucomicrobiota bacterium]